jgi:hypothetical protein
VQDLQHKLSDTSSKLAQEASRASTLGSKEAFIEKELAHARARGQELMGECQELEKEAALARKEHATLRREAEDTSALLVREKAQTKELEERVARTASEAAAAASEAQERLDAMLLRHAREVKSLTGREELLRNLIVHAEAQIDRLSAELYGDDYERAPLWPSDLALPGRSSSLTSVSVTPPEATDHEATAASPSASPNMASSARGGHGGLRAWLVSDLVDRLVQLEEALVHVHCVSTPCSASLARAVQGKVGKGGGGGGHSADRGEISTEREEWVLSEKSAAAVVMAAELTGFRHKVTLLEDELADATRKLAAKDTLRKKNLLAEERVQVLSRQLLAVTEERQELSRSYRVLCAKFAQASTAAQRDARQTSRADRDPSARTRGWSGRSPRHQHSRAHALSDSDEGAQQDAARPDFSLTGTAVRGRSRHMDADEPSLTDETLVGDGEDGGSPSEGASGEDFALDIDALYVSARRARSGGRAIVVEGRGGREQDGGVRRGGAGIVVKSDDGGLLRGRSLPSRRGGGQRDRERRRGDGVTSEQDSVQAVLTKARSLLDREREQKGGEGERERRGVLRASAQKAGAPALDRQSPRSRRGASGWTGVGYTKEGDMAWIEGKVRRLQVELDAFLADGGGEVSGMGVGALRDLQVPLVACPSAFRQSHHTRLHYRLFSLEMISSSLFFLCLLPLNMHCSLWV